MKYATFDADGLPIGFYASEVHQAIPADAVEITDAQWQELMDNQGRRKWLGGAIVPYDPPAGPEHVPDASPLQLYDELDEVHGIDLDDEIRAMSPKAHKRFRLAHSIRRNDPFIRQGLQPKLQWTDEQVDQLFRDAAKR